MSVYCPKCGADIENMCLECEDVAALQARVKELEGENAAVKNMHARILSWPPEDVERAYTALLQLAATEAHAGGDGKKARDAVDALRRHESQVEAERDALQARVKSLEQRRPAVHDLFEDLQLDYFELQARVKELEAQRVPNPGVVGTLRDKNTLLEYKDAQIAQLQECVKSLELTIREARKVAEAHAGEDVHCRVIARALADGKGK